MTVDDMLKALSTQTDRTAAKAARRMLERFSLGTELDTDVTMEKLLAGAQINADGSLAKK